MLAVSKIGRKLIFAVLITTLVLTGDQVVSTDQAVAVQIAANTNSNFIVSYRPSPSSQLIFRVSCQAYSAAGTHPNKKAICAAIAKQGVRLFTPVPADAMCTQIYGGPETAKITGTVKGRKINASFNRTDGCQIARWEKASALFTFPGYARVSGRIELSPTCGGPVRPGQDCTDPSATGTVTFTNKVHKTIKAKEIADNGFLVLVRNGTWRLTSSQTGAMGCTPMTISIPTSVEIVLVCDTGIR